MKISAFFSFFCFAGPSLGLATNTKQGPQRGKPTTSPKPPNWGQEKTLATDKRWNLEHERDRSLSCTICVNPIFSYTICRHFPIWSALFVYLRYLPYNSCAYILLIPHKPSSRPLHILPAYDLVFAISPVYITLSLYHAGRYPIFLLYPITRQKLATITRNRAVVCPIADYRKRQPTRGIGPIKTIGAPNKQNLVSIGADAASIT